MKVVLEEAWKQQGDKLYASCARAIIGFADMADAELQQDDLSDLLSSAGSALSFVVGGEEPDDLEIAFDAPGLSQALSDLITDLASLTDFGVQQIGRLLREVAGHASLARRDAAALATAIKILDLRSYEEPEDDSFDDAVAGMRAIRLGLDALDFSDLGEAVNSALALDPVEATDEVVSAASERLFDRMRATVSASVEAVRATGARIELEATPHHHHYKVDVKGCIPQEWKVQHHLIGQHGASLYRLIGKLDMLHALCGSDESIEKFSRDCASVGLLLPESLDGTLVTHLKEGRDGFAAFMDWYDAQPEAEHRCSMLKEKLRSMCDHYGLTGRMIGGINADMWLQAKRGARKVKRKGLMVIARPERGAAA